MQQLTSRCRRVTQKDTLLTHHGECNNRRRDTSQGLGVLDDAFVVGLRLPQSLVLEGFQGEDGTAVLYLVLVVVPGEGGGRVGRDQTGQGVVRFG